MKIAILGSAPSSMVKAPLGDPSWQIWACSPGTYASLSRVDAFYEVHRWEPGVIGKADTQKPWFSPEYVMWMRTVPPVVWVSDQDALRDLPNAKLLPWQELVQKYGHYLWTSSIAYMTAMAIDKIEAARAERKEKGLPDEQDVIGFWGIDMAANEELYSGQRAACQFFLQILAGKKINFYIPPESDLAVPPPMYGVSETHHRAIKWLERKRELQNRLAAANAAVQQGQNAVSFLSGALDDLTYMQTMWLHQGEDSLGIDFEKLFPEIAKARQEAKPATVAASVAEPATEAPSSTAKS